MPNEKKTQAPQQTRRWQRPLTIVGLLLVLMFMCLLTLPSLERLFLFFPSRWPTVTVSPRSIKNKISKSNMKLSLLGNGRFTRKLM
jgi:hypothetical protein